MSRLVTDSFREPDEPDKPDKLDKSGRVGRGRTRPPDEAGRDGRGRTRPDEPDEPDEPDWTSQTGFEPTHLLSKRVTNPLDHAHIGAMMSETISNTYQRTFYLLFVDYLYGPSLYRERWG